MSGRAVRGEEPKRAQRLGFWLGLAVFGAMLLLPAPDGLSAAGWRTAAGVLMALAGTVLPALTT